MKHRQTDPADPAADTRLRAFLREWHASEPSADFNTAVWRRIRAAPAPATLSLADFLRQWLMPHPVRLAAVAATITILAGTVAAFAIPAEHAHASADTTPLLHAQTLAGSYLAMVKGDAP